MKKYKEIEFLAGNTIEDAVNKLLYYKKKGMLVYGSFNGHSLYSDTVTMDSAYRKIIGKSKVEFDKDLKVEMIERIKRQKEEHKTQIPSLAKVWMEKGREILTEDKWKFWDKIVPIRLNDLYQGMELGCCLDIIKILNNNGTLDEAKEMIESQDHSGMSFRLVCSMVKEFCNKGKDFVDYISNK